MPHNWALSELKLTGIKTEIQTATDTANEGLSKAETIDLLTSKVHIEVAYKLHQLADDVEFLLSENRKRESHKFRNESYSRRENLVFAAST